MAVNVTLYVPGSKYVAEGFCKVDVAPFPKSQSHEVGLPVDKSLNFTTIGEQPETTSDVKFAVGACAWETR